MKVVGINFKESKLSELPKPKSFLDAASKRYYKEFGRVLIKEKILKEIHIMTLHMLATNAAQWEYAIREINNKNKLNSGSGYIQKYSTGATNISTELVLKRDAEKSMRENIAAFGMDPQSEKKLSAAVKDPGQLEMFNKFLETK